MMQELVSMKGVQSILQLILILDILSGTKEYHSISGVSYQNTFDEHETHRINTVYEYVLKNFRQEIALKDLADLLHMTPTSFSRYFTMKNNKPFSKFVAEIRIKHACKLLIETDDSVSRICYECGFNTLSNFNKQFKEIMMKRPYQYKKEFMSL